MRRRSNLAATSLILMLVVADPVGAAPLARATGAASYSFAFKDAELADVADAILGRALNLTYSIDTDVTAKVTFRIDRRMTPAELLQALETTLAVQDIAIVRSGQTLVLERRAKAKASSSVHSLEEGKHAVGYQTLAVPLSYASPQEVAKALQSVGAGGVVSFVDEAQNQIVLTGTAQEVEAAVQTIRMFDRSASASQKTRFFPLQRAPADGVAEEINQLLKAARVDGVSVVPMKRLGGVFAFARTSAGLEQVEAWIAKLDIATEDRSNTLWIYRPHNASAEGLKTALSSVLGTETSDGHASSATQDKRATETSTPTRARPAALTTASGAASIQAATQAEDTLINLSADNVRIGVDKDTNALLASATQPQWLQIQKLLAELDRAPGEVLIEASIIEVTLTKDNNFGVDFSVLSPAKHLNVGLNAAASGVVGAIYPGFTINYADGNLKAAVNALSASSKIQVISAPKIITLDNKAATLDVGDQVPVVAQSAQSTETANAPLVNTVNYRNTGVILKVTPRITGADTILLDVSQEVSSVASTTTSDIDSPTILQRHLESSLILSDGGVVALGGMISSTKSTGESGIPFLKDLPGVGPLFRTTTNSLNRTELVVLITARIIRDRAGAERVLTDITTDMQELKAHGPLRP